MTKYITVKENWLRQLMIDQEKLERLEGAGVDNWCGYDIALGDEFADEDFFEWKDKFESEPIEQHPNIKSEIMDE